jgi:serine protease Do
LLARNRSVAYPCSDRRQRNVGGQAGKASRRSEIELRTRRSHQRSRGRDIGAGPYDDYIQIDASVNKGNSGGPTFDMDGNVIGVNTAIFSPSGGSVGIAFDIPSDTVKSVVAQLKDKGVVSRGWIGVQIQPVTAEIAEYLGMKGSEGALVTEPQAGSPAVKGGIESGDVITSVNGRVVKEKRCTLVGGLRAGGTGNTPRVTDLPNPAGT